MGDLDLTQTRSIAGTSARAPTRSAQLFVVLQGARPLDPPRRHRLRGIDEVLVGRASAPLHERQGSTLRLGLVDPTLSSRHLRITRRPASWELCDLGSKNGTFVGDHRIDRHAVSGTVLLRVGQVGLLLRPDADDDPSAPDDLAVDALPGPPGLHTLEPGLARRFEDLRRIARADAAVLVGGETGTGKELIARAVHALSGREGPFVAVNCGALSEGLLHAELFGHRKGAFSGATADREGWVLASSGGTLFLDELAELPAAAQAALLRVVQEREVVAVGDTRPCPVDLRIVSATHRELEAMVAAGEFREDLLARLAGFRLSLPPVRERVADRGLLVRALLSRRPDAARVRFGAGAVDRLLHAPWPRNVRELERALTTALALTDDGAVEAEHLPAVETTGAPASSAVSPRSSDRHPVARTDGGDEALRAEVRRRLVEHGGNVSAVARAMGKHRQQVQKWIRRFALDVEAIRRETGER